MSYATIAQADLELTTEPWISLTDEQKQAALDIGTLWIDDKYSCAVTDPVEPALVQANILLADKYVNGVMFVAPEGVITSKKVKADSVESEKSYQNGTQQGVNPYAEIELLLGSVCAINSSLSEFTVRRV